MIDRAVELGAEHVLFAPTNTDVRSATTAPTTGAGRTCSGWASASGSARAPGTRAADPLPANVHEMLDYARARKVGLLAYVYPVLAFEQDPVVAGHEAQRRPERAAVRQPRLPRPSRTG